MQLHGKITKTGSGGAIQTEKTVTPTKSIQAVTPDSAFMGLRKVIVNAIPSEYILPTGTKSIDANGTGIDVKNYASVDVTVLPNLQEKDVTANGSYTPDAGYDGFSKVNVDVPVSDIFLQQKQLTVTANGEQTVTCDQGFNGLSSVLVTVALPTYNGSVSILGT